MQLSSLPTKMPTIWAANAPGADVRVIPIPSQAAITPGAASFQDGFPPPNFLPVTAGGVPPFGQDFNGILRVITQWLQWQQAGNPGITYDATFSASVGGYPQGAVLAAAGVSGYFWISTADNNTSNPDAGGANWVSVNLLGTLSTGDVKLSFKTTADPGYVLMNDGSIGDASSGATTLASALTQSLFTLLYNNVVDAWAPIQTSGGGATTRAAQGTAATAYAAHCRLVLPLMLGRALCVAGAGSGLTTFALGANFGENNHLLTVNEMPSHNHTVNGTNALVSQAGNNGAQTLAQIGGTVPTSFTGGGVTHNNMQPSGFLTAMVAL